MQIGLVELLPSLYIVTTVRIEHEKHLDVQGKCTKLITSIRQLKNESHAIYVCLDKTLLNDHKTSFVRHPTSF